MTESENLMRGLPKIMNNPYGGSALALIADSVQI